MDLIDDLSEVVEEDFEDIVAMHPELCNFDTTIATYTNLFRSDEDAQYMVEYGNEW